MDWKKNLEWRSIINQIANEEKVQEIVNDGSAFYIGVDPTADSIHIGHYMSFVASKHLADLGMKPVFVIGGLTASIGDPSGKNEERPVIDNEVVKQNADKLTKVIEDVAKKLEIKEFEVINNMTFYEGMSIIDLLQKYGKLFNVNQMLSRESVQKRIDTGISFTEFSYQAFQAIDFLKLFETKDVRLQLGGSDQWGNMISGLELIRKVKGQEKDVSVITFKLITDNEGNKIGKTAGNPVWLEKEKFSSYNLYQYILNQTDEEAKQLLVKLTLITEGEFHAVIEKQGEDRAGRPVQKELAKRLITRLHSAADYEKAVEMSEVLFAEEYEKISAVEAKEIFVNIPTLNNEDKPLIDLVVDQEAISSKREYREFLKNGAIKVNGVKVETEEDKIGFIQDTFAVVQLGKKKKFIIWK